MKAIISTWRTERFQSVTGHGNRWPKYIYSTINGGDSTTCAMYCQLDDSCSYFVYNGGNCYLGDCSVTSQTLANQGSATVTYKAGKIKYTSGQN